MKRRFLLSAVALVVFHFSSAQEKVSLEQVVTLSLEKNYDVRIAQQLAEGAATDDAFANAAFLPQINAVGATTWNKNESEVRFAPEFSDRNRKGPAESNNTTASVQLVWTLFDGTRMFSTRERIDETAEQAKLAVKDQMNNTVANVVLNYYDVVRQKQQLRAIHEQMAVSEERVKLAEKKLQVGTGIKPELLQARVDLNAQRAQILQQEALISQLKQQLNALTGLQLPVEFDVADTILIDLDINADEISENIENSNLTLLAARKNLNISSLSVRERRAEYLPFLNFNAAYNFGRVDNTKVINVISPIFNETTGLNYGFSVTLPILNGFNTRRLVQQAKIEYGRQSLLYEQQKTNVNVNLRNAWVNYTNAKKILTIEEETIGAARENVVIALETFKRGVSTSVELRIAQQSFADAYNRLIAARYNTKIAEIELQRLNGSLLK